MERPTNDVGVLPHLPHGRELEKTLTGIRGLDEITRGGLPKGRPTLICGGAGSGKTLLALTFLVNGATRFDEPGVVMTFEENTDELASDVASLGFDLPELIAAQRLAVDISQVGHISQLISDLLDVEAVVSGKIRLNRQPLDLAETVRRGVATFTIGGEVDRHIEISTEPLWVEGDASRLAQVLTNILTNAIKYTPPGGRIRVALRADGGDAAHRRGQRVRHLAQPAARHLRHVRAGRSDTRPRSRRVKPIDPDQLARLLSESPDGSSQVELWP